MAVRFVIEVSGTPRTVFGVSEQTSGDLNIHITSGGRDYSGKTINDLVAISDESVFEDCDKHISVHTSSRSLSVNVIKRTQVFVDRVEDFTEFRKGALSMHITWPISAAAQFASWATALLK